MSAASNYTNDKIATLVQLNRRWLGQAIALLETVPAHSYTEPAPGLPQHRAGAQLRHVIEFYESFFRGLADAHIDYDARRRDLSLEGSQHSAIRRLTELTAQLEHVNSGVCDLILHVRMEDSDSNQDCWLTSSVSRELQALSSHTIHHFALIAVAIQAHGVDVPADFGVAPSTLRYRSQQAERCAA